MAITRNRESRIVWLEQGNERRGFNHILVRYRNRFQIFNILDHPQDIGNLIFKAITNYPIVKKYRELGDVLHCTFIKFGEKVI